MIEGNVLKVTEYDGSFLITLRTDEGKAVIEDSNFNPHLLVEFDERRRTHVAKILEEGIIHQTKEEKRKIAPIAIKPMGQLKSPYDSSKNVSAFKVIFKNTTDLNLFTKGIRRRAKYHGINYVFDRRGVSARDLYHLQRGIRPFVGYRFDDVGSFVETGHILRDPVVESFDTEVVSLEFQKDLRHRFPDPKETSVEIYSVSKKDSLGNHKVFTHIIPSLAQVAKTPEEAKKILISFAGEAGKELEEKLEVVKSPRETALKLLSIVSGNDLEIIGGPDLLVGMNIRHFDNPVLLSEMKRYELQAPLGPLGYKGFVVGVSSEHPHLERVEHDELDEIQFKNKYPRTGSRALGANVETILGIKRGSERFNMYPITYFFEFDSAYKILMHNLEDSELTLKLIEAIASRANLWEYLSRKPLSIDTQIRRPISEVLTHLLDELYFKEGFFVPRDLDRTTIKKLDNLSKRRRFESYRPGRFLGYFVKLLVKPIVLIENNVDISTQNCNEDLCKKYGVYVEREKLVHFCRKRPAPLPNILKRLLEDYIKKGAVRTGIPGLDAGFQARELDELTDMARKPTPYASEETIQFLNLIIREVVGKLREFAPYVDDEYMFVEASSLEEFEKKVLELSQRFGRMINERVSDREALVVSPEGRIAYSIGLESENPRVVVGRWLTFPRRYSRYVREEKEKLLKTLVLRGKEAYEDEIIRLIREFAYGEFDEKKLLDFEIIGHLDKDPDRFPPSREISYPLQPHHALAKREKSGRGYSPKQEYEGFYVRSSDELKLIDEIENLREEIDFEKYLWDILEPFGSVYNHV